MNKSKQIDYHLAIITLVVISIQYLWIEGWDISKVKVVFMAFCPLLALWRGIVITKAIVMLLIYWVASLMLQMLHPTFEVSTYIYTLLFIFSFHLYYGLVWNKKCFTLEGFINVLRLFITAFFVCMILQQFCYFAGIRLPLINYYGYGCWKFNSLSIEPSHLARLLTAFMYAYLKCQEYYYERPPSIMLLWRKHRMVICMFFYMMLTMGSGTAMVGIVIVASYFVKTKYLMFVLPSVFVLYLTMPLIDYEPLNRAYATVNAAITMDEQEVIKADHSASARVNVLLATAKVDVLSSDFWIGQGLSSDAKGAMSISKMGAISFVFRMFFLLTCCFTSLLCIEMLSFIVLFALSLCGNFAYGWAVLMIYTTVKYFKINRKQRF